MGEGCIDIRRIKHWMLAAGFEGYDEVEVFSARWWAADQNEYLAKITQAWREHCQL